MIQKLLNKKPKYSLNKEGEFVIENYNFAKPFANFFPGIAGKYGIPMWVFYVNRAQAVISFGTKDKDHAILEFLPANKAWQAVSSLGFRTFIKILGKGLVFYEPFSNGFVNAGFDISNKMSISSHSLILEEDNLSLGLKITVEYFNIPNDSYAGLARIVTIKNLSRAKKTMQLLDGLPQVIPFGTSNLFLKKLSRTIEAWMGVENLNKAAPFYKLDVDPTDRPEVIHIKAGNFYLGFHYDQKTPKIIKPIVDTECVFASFSDFSLPYKFLAKKEFLYPARQITESRTPCAFLPLNLKLASDEEKVFYSVVGNMRSLEILNASLEKITHPDYLKQKKQENKEIVERLQKDINTRAGSKEFSLYAKQTYLDNIIRGGYPEVFKSNSGSSVFYLYSRKHGDLERDYNKFQIQPAYFSQGNGNYRDINQNRRCDIWFNPDVKDDSLIYFFNLLQSDGFNPLIVKGAKFIIKEGIDLKQILKDKVEENQISRLILFLDKPFTPGDLAFFAEENKIISPPCDDFINLILSHSLKTHEAEHGEGFWTDHWTYNLDLLESYLGVYPEKLKEIIFEKEVFTYYDNSETVKPRCEKYLLYNGLPRQLHSTAASEAKKEIFKKRAVFAHTLRSQYGNGEIYRTTLIDKLICLFVNKMASLDPSGIGIEMEANKPNWFDALNGLPALFGSSLCETFELKRLAIFIKDALDKAGAEKIFLTEEIYDFLVNLDGLIREYFLSGSPERDFQYWDKSYSLKENYRQKTLFGFGGGRQEAKTLRLREILDNALRKIESGITKAYDKKRAVYYSYFINEVTRYEVIREPFIRPLQFAQRKLPLFLEGQMHALRLAQNKDEAEALYRGTRSGELYDKELKMYKVTAPLKNMPEEIGRCRVFTPGWLENESIWLHMEYKYLLELLKKGLYSEFFGDLKNTLIPFQPSQRYGRSILENSSFLVSSKFPDKKLHGTGFVARLSGSTAEFLQIWLVMNLGHKPFFLNEQGELNLALRPLLAGWLFDRKGIYSFNFLKEILVTYYNPKRKDTFGRNAVNPKRIVFTDKDGNPVKLASGVILSPYAGQIRARQIKSIEVYLE